MAPICGIDAETLRDVARTYARAEASIIFWGMGISQHIHGTDNARCLIALALSPGRSAAPAPGCTAARPEQRPGRVGCGTDPDVLSRLSAGRDAKSPRILRAALGHRARSQARPHRGRDHQRDPCRRNHRHVYRGREPGDVGPRRAARPRGAGQARASGGAGHLPDRDGLARRRDPAGLGLPREDRHLHQHRPPGAARPHGAAAAGRGAPGSRDHPSIWPTGWAAAGITRTSATSIPRWPTPCRRSRTSAGSGWCARAR